MAYNLNDFYLNKRHYDGIKQSSGKEYHYYLLDDTGELTEQTSHYPINAAAKDGSLGYVESRYADGDFRFAGGTIPDAIEKRQKNITVQTIDGSTTTTAEYYPVWPDDYLFFGQMLSYGYDESNPHEDTPSHLFKQSGSIPLTKQSNRVYRAPAYFPQAYLAAHSAPKSAADTDWTLAYPAMTAVDFAGHNDQSYVLGLDGKLFYQPLLDDDGLIGVSNNYETPNLLVYAPAEVAANEGDYANKNTYDVLNGYFIGTPTNRTEPVYSSYTESSSSYDDNNSYGRIAVASTDAIHGHLVQSDLQTTTDHLLVDKRDFNCPITYTMGEGYRMWYQRTPDNFVTASWSNDATPKRTTKGWEGVSLPFTTEIVATQDKGELTHFYQGSTTGHEYWQ